MKLKTSFFTIFVAICMLGMWSCSEEDIVDEISGGCLSYVEASQSYLDASQAYSQNPTVENCEAFKVAWINFLEEFRDCPYWEGAEYQEAINEAQSIDCSQQ